MIARELDTHVFWLVPWGGIEKRLSRSTMQLESMTAFWSWHLIRGQPGNRDHAQNDITMTSEQWSMV
jgi:hypothetical protein